MSAGRPLVRVDVPGPTGLARVVVWCRHGTHEYRMRPSSYHGLTALVDAALDHHGDSTRCACLFQPPRVVEAGPADGRGMAGDPGVSR